MLVALATPGSVSVTAAGPPGQSQAGAPRNPPGFPSSPTGIPGLRDDGVTPARGRFQAAVKLVKLDSCDAAVLAKPPRKPIDMEEAAELGRARAEMERYHAMLAAYAGGDAAGSIEAVIGLSRRRLARDWTGLTRALYTINTRGIDPYAPWDARRYALAVMLHTDAALQAAGDTYGDEAFVQFQVAADLLQLGVRCAPDRFRSLAPKWYVGLSRYLRDRTVLGAADALLELGRSRLQNDPAILGESGVLAESIATIYALSQMDTRTSWVSSDDRLFLRRVTDRRQAWLNDAASWLRQAADLDPGNDEVLLHLGRVRALRFEDAEALSTLGTVLERTPSNDMACLAAIFTGAVHDRRNRLEEAAAAYRAAVDRTPGAHAARVGLADVLRRSGRLDEARRLILALVTERSEKVQEPLWWYILEPPGMADARLAALRAEVRR
jgi:tetratricopeptide (TPR) repeat protein